MHISFKAALGMTALGWLGLAANPASASLDATLTGLVTPQSGGGFLYTYTADDLATSTLGISQFDLDVSGGQSTVGIVTPTGALLSNITVPNGFLALYTTGDPTITFSSTVTSTGAVTDILPGQTGTFSFTSPSAPSSQSYVFLSFDDPNVPLVQEGGQVLSPSPLTSPAVPETFPLALLALGLLPLGLLARRRRHA